MIHALKTAKACRDRWCRIHRIGNGRKPKRRGLEVMVIEQAPHILPTLDEEMAAL